ncbi:MAG TPA: MarR family transcriptional regulator [Opitutaceae bacterium]|nr:MarR family transcriptional regulator [Opitutaceae bacterium]
MFLLRDLPDQDCLQRLKARYPEMESESIRAIMCLVRTANDVTEGFERFLAKHGLSHGRFAILMYLNRNPDTPVNQTHLAEAYGVSKATITGLIDGLERDLMVERLPDPTDRRASLVRLAPAGREFLAGFLPDHFRAVSRLMSGLDTKDRAKLLELLCRVRSGLDDVLGQNPSCGWDCGTPPKASGHHGKSTSAGH